MRRCHVGNDPNMYSNWAQGSPQDGTTASRAEDGNMVGPELVCNVGDFPSSTFKALPSLCRLSRPLCLSQSSKDLGSGNLVPFEFSWLWVKANGSILG